MEEEEVVYNPASVFRNINNIISLARDTRECIKPKVYVSEKERELTEFMICELNVIIQAAGRGITIGREIKEIRNKPVNITLSTAQLERLQKALKSAPGFKDIEEALASVSNKPAISWKNWR